MWSLLTFVSLSLAATSAHGANCPLNGPVMLRARTVYTVTLQIFARMSHIACLLPLNDRMYDFEHTCALLVHACQHHTANKCCTMHGAHLHMHVIGYVTSKNKRYGPALCTMHIRVCRFSLTLSNVYCALIN